MGLELQEGRRARGTVAREVVYLREHQEGRDNRSTQRRKEGPGRGAVDTSLEGGCVYIPEDRPVLGSGHGGTLVGLETLWCTGRRRLLCPHSRPASLSKN